MEYTSRPLFLEKPFASDGSKRAVPVASQIGIENGAASYSDGFPPLTMTPVGAGGIPPAGLDMNGVLYDISRVCQWAQLGIANGYWPNISTTVGGYPVGASVNYYPFGNFESTQNNNTTDPASDAANWLAAPSNRVYTADLSAPGAKKTIHVEWRNASRIILTGSLTETKTLVFNKDITEWLVYIDASAVDLNGHRILIETTYTGVWYPETLPIGGGWVRISPDSAINHEDAIRSTSSTINITDSWTPISMLSSDHSQGANFTFITSQSAAWLLISTNSIDPVGVIYTNIGAAYTIEFRRTNWAIEARVTAVPSGPLSYNFLKAITLGG